MRPNIENTARALRRDPRIMVRFWSQVTRHERQEKCWEWHGSVSAKGQPSFHVGQRSVAPSHLSWFWSTGELPTCGRIERLCENPRCVRPRHLGWLVGRAAERHALAETDGYLSLPGVAIAVDDPELRMPRMMRLASDRP